MPIKHRLNKDVETASAGQAYIEIGRSLAVTQEARLSGPDGVHSLERYGLLKAAAGDIAGPVPALRHGHLSAVGPWCVSIDADKGDKGAAIATLAPTGKVWNHVIVIRRGKTRICSNGAIKNADCH